MVELCTLFFLIRSLAIFTADTVESMIARNEKVHGFFIQIRGDLELMQEYLEQAEEMRVRSKGMDAWLGRVKEAAYQVEDLVDQFLALAQSRSGGGVLGVGNNVLRYHKDMTTAHDIVTDAKRVTEMIFEIWKKRIQLGITGSSGEGPSRRGRNQFPEHLPRFDEAENILGIGENIELLMQWLVPTSSDDDRHQERRVISVWGMGGLGKTTLVRTVYHCPAAKERFQARIWVSVTESYDVDELLKSMIHELQGAVEGQGQEGGELSDTRPMTSKLSELLHQKRYLMVLDDVWNSSVCNQLLEHLPSNNNGSRILVTTRDGNVASAVSRNEHVLNVSPLSPTDARLLFHKAAFKNGACPRELEHSAQMIIDKCDGLPLALVAIGRVMAGEPTTDIAWNNMFQRLEWELSNHKMFKAMAQGLMLSYKRLPYYLQRCFLYSCMFKEDNPIKTKWLIRMWMAEGFIDRDPNNNMTMEEIGVSYVEQLAAMSMIQVVKKDAAGRPKVCRVHDIMRDLARTASKGENLCVTNVNQLTDPGPNCRRLSIMRSLDRVPTELPLSHIRTLLVFTNNPFFTSSLWTMCERLKFLRVLNLRGAPIHDLPTNVFKLFNLRYLSLRATDVNKIPRTVKKLYNLQTLDLWKTRVTGLPRRILKLQSLRHLYMEDIFAEELMYRNIGEILRGPGAPSGISDLRYLQTLKTVRASPQALIELDSMTQLRNLGITKLNYSDGPALCESIRKMERLSRLSIKASDKQRLDLDSLSPPPANLHKLILNGCMRSMPVWFSSLNRLTHLYLFSSQLKEKDGLIPSLGSLPYLVLLALDDNAYQGGTLHFKAGAFGRLETLLLSKLGGLYSLSVEERGLPTLQVMYLGHLKILKVVTGIKYITTMHTLQCRGLPNAFKFETSDLKHIPSIKNFF